MAKIIRKSNFRVVVEPKRLGDFGMIKISDDHFGQTPDRIEKDYMARCKEIVDQIKRHVDEVDRIDIDFDTEEFCSHCNYGWELDENDVPLCCDEAIAEHEQAKIITASIK